jgi:hypothetical protein
MGKCIIPLPLTVQKGWHIPSVSEWKVLVADSLFELIKIHSSSISSMVSNETNASKLSIHPTGWRDFGCGDLMKMFHFGPVILKNAMKLHMSIFI